MFYLHHFHIKLLPFMRLFQLFVKLAVCLFVWSSSICAKNNILPKISKLEQLHGVYEIGINVVGILEKLFQKQGVSTSKMWVSLQYLSSFSTDSGNNAFLSLFLCRLVCPCALLIHQMPIFHTFH